MKGGENPFALDTIVKQRRSSDETLSPRFLVTVADLECVYGILLQKNRQLNESDPIKNLSTPTFLCISSFSCAGNISTNILNITEISF